MFFATDVPLGIVFIALLFGGMLLFSIFGFIFSHRGKKRFRNRVLNIFMLVVISAAAFEIAFDKDMEWNPVIKSDAQVVDVWVSPSETLELHADKTFRYFTPDRIITGTWSRDDWNLTLKGEGFTAAMRFVDFRGHLHILTHPPAEPGSWSGDWGLQRRRN